MLISSTVLDSSFYLFIGSFTYFGNSFVLAYLLFAFCSYNIPLVADIHFAPSVAMCVAECFDKIRVNPGNFGM